MTNFDLQFFKLICFGQLNLSKGDSLSINTEESTYGFTLNLAKFATNITNLPVTIVVTEKGKVTQTVPVDPELLDIQRPEIKSQLMCRILDLDKFLYESEKDPHEIINSVVEISEYGVLSEPIDLKRRIALPWTVVPYPSKTFVEKAFSPLEDNEVYAYFAKLLRLDHSNMLQYWANQSGLLDYRVKELNSLKDNKLQIKSRRSKLECELIEDSIWASNYITLKNNRSFFNFLPSQNVHNNIKRDSTNAHIEATRDFYLFGQIIKNATFNIKDGKVISYNATEGKKALDAFFKSDKNANVVSSISLCDEETIEAKYINKSAHPLYSLENSTSIVLGGAMQDSLLDIDEEADLDLLKVNQSLVKLAIPIGDEFTNISIGESNIIKEGSFSI